MQVIGLFAVLLAVIGTLAMAQENRKADDLGALERRVMKEISAFESDRRGFDTSVPRADGELLRRLVEENKVRNAVEIGTFRGYSGLWLGLGLLRTRGRSTAFEISPRRCDREAEVRARCFPH
jgi:predicted O-methyltransferase YrrM